MKRILIAALTILLLLFSVSPSFAAGLSVKASVAKPTITQNSKQTVTVVVKDLKGKPVLGALGTLAVHYKTKNITYAISKTNTKGVSIVSFGIGRATKGFKVNCDAVMKKGKLTGAGRTSFVTK
ncbi:MAG TPA: hypothetical protein VGK02_01085 [Candidatus Aquicultor sp.]|jgi:hypothetical protein